MSLSENKHRKELTNARFVKTGILSQSSIENLTKAGFEFAEIDDAARAVMKLCSDPSINGRTFAITPRSVCESGYADTAADEYHEESPVLKTFQDLALGAKHRQV